MRRREGEMERDHHHQHHQVPKQQETTSSFLLSQNPKQLFTYSSPKKNININTTTNNDRLKRDEWSEGAVSSLLEAYEAKWTLRNRAKLKGQDWEEVAKNVSARAGVSKSAKTQTQCKNKIESMKKRYRSESAADATSSWPLYPRLHLLLRGNIVSAAANPPDPVVMVVPPPQLPVTGEIPPVGLGLGSVHVVQNSHGSNDGDRVAKKEGDGKNNGAKLSINGDESEKNPIDDTDSSTAPTIYTEIKDTNVDPFKKSKGERKDHNKLINKRAREEYWDEIGESIRWVAEVVVRSEEARMEIMREIEKMRAEADAKRGEIDLKRTEIIANTQLQIAKLFANGSSQDWKKLT